MPIIRLLNMYITSHSATVNMRLYRGGGISYEESILTDEVVRQPMYVSLSEDIHVAMRCLREGMLERWGLL